MFKTGFSEHQTEHLNYLNKKIPAFQENAGFFFKLSIFQWSWRESNPRPNKEAIRFLHAYSGLDFRDESRPGLPNPSLSSKISLRHRGLPQLFPNLPHRWSDRLGTRAVRAMSRSLTW